MFSALFLDCNQFVLSFSTDIRYNRGTISIHFSEEGFSLFTCNIKKHFQSLITVGLLMLVLFGCSDLTVGLTPDDTSPDPTGQSVSASPTEPLPSPPPPTDPTQPSTAPTQPTEPDTQPSTAPTQSQPTETQTQPIETQTQPTEVQTEPTEPLPTLPIATNPVDPQPDNATGDKVIYLTFDDGPGIYTPALLDILEKYNVKVTFFVVGSSKLDYLDEIAQAGHSIGIHSNTHRYDQVYTDTDAFWSDFYALEDKIFQRTGIHTKLHRFPGGSSNTTSQKYCKGIMSTLVQEMKEKGYFYFDWNVDSNDAGGATTPGEVYHNVITAVQNKTTSVVLMHDVKPYTVEAIESIIRWGLENGYVFLPLSESSPEVHHTVRN